MKETAIMVCVRDRPSEVAMLLESLYFQTYKDFDIFIRDDMSGTSLNSYHFFNCIIARLVLRNHKVIVNRNDIPLGVSKNRQQLIEDVKDKGYKYVCRIDDDVVLESDFLERLIKVIESGYDLASGVTPPMSSPTFIRDSKYLNIGNQVVLDNEGSYILNNDDFG